MSVPGEIVNWFNYFEKQISNTHQKVDMLPSLICPSDLLLVNDPQEIILNLGESFLHSAVYL